MARSVDFFKKQYDRAIASVPHNPNKEFIAAIAVLNAYTAKRNAIFHYAASQIVNYFTLIINQPAGFTAKILNREEPLYNYFTFAIEQQLGLIDLKTNVDINTIYMYPQNLIRSSREGIILDNEIISQSFALTLDVKKKLLGAFINSFTNSFEQYFKRSGFASVCFVLAKELQLHNLSDAVWDRLINSANFPTDFLKRTTSSSRRASERLQLQERERIQSRTIPPAYFAQTNTQEPLPPYEEPAIMLNTENTTNQDHSHEPPHEYSPNADANDESTQNEEAPPNRNTRTNR